MDNLIFENRLILELCKIYIFGSEKIDFFLSRDLNYPYILGQLFYNRVSLNAL